MTLGSLGVAFYAQQVVLNNVCQGLLEVRGERRLVTRVEKEGMREYVNSPLMKCRIIRNQFSSLTNSVLVHQAASIIGALARISSCSTASRRMMSPSEPQSQVQRTRRQDAARNVMFLSSRIYGNNSWSLLGIGSDNSWIANVISPWNGRNLLFYMWVEK